MQSLNCLSILIKRLCRGQLFLPVSYSALEHASLSLRTFYSIEKGDSNQLNWSQNVLFFSFLFLS